MTRAGWRARIRAAWRVLLCTDPRLVLVTQKRKLEAISRDAGCTKRQAARITALYFAAEARPDGQ